jgi:hypothetical protein
MNSNTPFNEQLNEQPITEDELIGLVSGSLPEAEFERVSSAVAASPELLARLEQLELIRDGLAQDFEPIYTDAENKQAAQKMLRQLDAPQLEVPPPKPQYVPTPHAGGKPWKPPKRTRWLYGALAAQAFCILGLGVIALPVLQSNVGNPPPLVAQNDVQGGDAPIYRSVGVPAGAVLLAVQFAPTATEREIRGLLLDVQALIVSGPTQLGEYQLAVLSNKADAALKKLQGAAFVESAKLSAGAVSQASSKVDRP